MEQSAGWGHILKRERLLRGLSQSDVAEKCGCDVRTVGRWERDITCPSPYYTKKLMKLFNKNAEELGLVDRDEPGLSLFEALPESSGGKAYEHVLNSREDWSDAPPESASVYGRADALSTTTQWVLDGESRIVAILGPGGIGKTTFARQVAGQVRGQFDYVFWRSLKDAPPVEETLDALLHFLISHPLKAHQSLEERLSLLVATMRNVRCLIILDNVESILQTGQRSGDYLDAFKGYSEVFRRIGEAQHRSCVLLTGREKPGDFTALEATTSAIRSCILQGITVQDSQKLLKRRQLQGPQESWEAFVHHYAGNPLMLKLISSSIQEHFNGDIDAFLAEGEMVFGDIQQLLDMQFQRVSSLEKVILFWLAIEREAVTRKAIRENFIQPFPKGTLTEAIDGLLRRSLIETTSDNRLTLQPVVMEYLSTVLLESVYQEIIAGRDAMSLCSTHALMKANGSDYIRASQVRLFLIPLVERLVTTSGQDESEQHLKTLLAELRSHHMLATSYAPGNILNLLIYLNADLHRLDCSQLTLRQVALSGVELPYASFRQTTFRACTFTDTFTSILGLAVSRNGQLLAAGTTTGEIRLWRLNDASPFLSCSGHTDGVRAIAFSADGQVFASASEDFTVRLWDSRAGDCRYVLRGHTAWVRTVAFHPQSMLLASGGDDESVRLWDARTGELQQVLHGLHGHHAPIRTLAFHPLNGLLITGDDNGTVCIWESATGICLSTLQAHEQALRTLAFNSDGSMLATGSEDHQVRLWQFAPWQHLATLSGHTSRVRTVAFRDDGLFLASGGDDNTIYLWNVQERQNIRSIQGHSNRLWSLAFVPKSHILISASEDDTLCWWQTDTGDCLRNLHGYTDLIKSVAWSPDGTMLVSGSEDDTVRLWNTSSGTGSKVLREHTNRVRTVAWSPDGMTIASGSEDETVRLWNSQTGQLLHVLRGHRHLVRCVRFSPDGHVLMSGSYDGTVRLWDIEGKQYRRTIQTQHGAVLDVAFSPDGQHFVSAGDDGFVCLWDVTTGVRQRTFEGHHHGVWSVAWSPDGSTLASGSDDGTIRLWNVRTGETHRVLQGHMSQVRGVAFHPEGRILVSGGHDGTVRLWDVESGQLLKTLTGHQGWIGTVAFSPDGNRIASGSDDSTIRLWDSWSGECIWRLKRESPYEHVDITGAQGLSEAQKTSLRHLGARDNYSS